MTLSEVVAQGGPSLRETLAAPNMGDVVTRMMPNGEAVAALACAAKNPTRGVCCS